ncbi:FliH/SctL family protein [Pseudomonas fildesensis]|uniref:Type III secretion protein n=1 Tax=Pseudomonas fildesensis TaxID=1674920 RepID=A0A0J8FW56_9PSED|nr:FliH/SctL family protein [Pseudomonas fildesensis]KMT54507.1 type III secretion protein [Pseudomonas fildesensis]
MSELPTRPAARILRAEQADLWIDGYAFVQAAKEEAQNLRNESASWLEQAREAGFESARQQGAQEVGALLIETSLKVDAWLSGLEASMADLALGIVREVLDDMNDAERIVRCTRKALNAFRQDQSLSLFVPRQDVEAVRHRLKSELDNLSMITLESDDQLAPGQARLSSPVGSVELGLEAQLNNLRRYLLPFADGQQP